MKLISSLEYMQKLAFQVVNKEIELQIIDTRSFERFNAEVPEPVPVYRLGHVEGSSCLPFDKMLVDKTVYKSKEELLKVFEEHKVDFEKPICLTCG